MPWQTTVTAQKPHARCSQCGSRELVAVCHECGAALCADHVERLPERRWYHAFPEFADLNLERTEMGEEGVHCPACFHFTYALDTLIWSVALLGVTAFFLMLFLTWRRLLVSVQGWLVVVLGLLLVLVSLVLAVIYTTRQGGRKPPPLPVLGRFPTVEVQEYVGGQIQLGGNGAYSSSVGRSAGVLGYQVRFANLDQERRRLYQRKYRGRVPANLHFNAGFLVGKGRARLAFTGAAAGAVRQPNTLALTAPVVDHPLLSGLRAGPDDPPLDSRWQQRYRYRFELDGQLPLQLLPALVADGDQIGLELLVQLLPGSKTIDGEGVWVDRLRLCAPRALGPALACRPSAQVDPAGDLCPEPDFRAVVWQDVALGQAAAADEHPPFPSVTQPYARFFVRFKNYLLLQQATLHGQLQLRLEEQLLSGLEEIVLCYPLGQVRRDARVRCGTTISVGFRLNLEQVPFRATCIQTGKKRYPVVPDYLHLIPLVERLEADGFYVKRLVESPPQVNRASAGLISRSWQIDGRDYQGIRPLDFQLVLTGYERYEDGPRPVAGETTVDLHVMSQVRTKQMYRQLQQLLQVLTASVEDVLG